MRGVPRSEGVSAQPPPHCQVCPVLKAKVKGVLGAFLSF